MMELRLQGQGYKGTSRVTDMDRQQRQKDVRLEHVLQKNKGLRKCWCPVTLDSVVAADTGLLRAPRSS